MATGPISDPEREFLAHLRLIERLASKAARLHRLPSTDAEDFVSHVKVKLLENDYARLRRFRGESSLAGFLAVTIGNLCRDYADHLWGKWRPPAVARKLGPLAVLLQRLMTREQMPVEAAYETLWTNYGVTATRAELDALAARLPPPVVRQFETDDVLTSTPSPGKQPDEIAADREALRTALRAEAALKRGMATLPPPDRLILVLHYRDGLKVSEIARQLAVPQAPLYERLKAAVKSLAEAFRADGLDSATVLPVLECWSPDPGWDSIAT